MHRTRCARKIAACTRNFQLIGKVERAGYTLVPVDPFSPAAGSRSRSAFPRAKSSTTKRNAEQEKDWKREQGRLLEGQAPLNGGG